MSQELKSQEVWGVGGQIVKKHKSDGSYYVMTAIKVRKGSDLIRPVHSRCVRSYAVSIVLYYIPRKDIIPFADGASLF